MDDMDMDMDIMRICIQLPWFDYCRIYLDSNKLQIGWRGGKGPAYILSLPVTFL